MQRIQIRLTDNEVNAIASHLADHPEDKSRSHVIRKALEAYISGFKQDERQQGKQRKSNSYIMDSQN